MIDHVSSALGPQLGTGGGREQAVRTDGGRTGFAAALQQELERSEGRQVAFSKHAMARAEERGVEVTPGLLDRLTDSVERIATNTFIITPYNVDLTGDDVLDELENNGLYF